MASGYSYTGGRSRCFAYWQEFSKCYAQTDIASNCRPQGEDYIECLFHRREIERAKQIKAEFIRKAVYQTKEGRKVADALADGVIVGVGLIRRDKAGEAGVGENKSA